MAEIVDQTIVKHRAAKRRHKEDTKPWRNWKRRSCLNIFLTVEVPSKGFCDLIEFLNSIKNDVHSIISKEVGVRRALKFYLTVRPPTVTV